MHSEIICERELTLLFRADLVLLTPALTTEWVFQAVHALKQR